MLGECAPRVMRLLTAPVRQPAHRASAVWVATAYALTVFFCLHACCTVLCGWYRLARDPEVTVPLLSSLVAAWPMSVPHIA
eukprot:3403168-Rhodomonas_salina.1